MQEYLKTNTIRLKKTHYLSYGLWWQRLDTTTGRRNNALFLFVWVECQTNNNICSHVMWFSKTMTFDYMDIYSNDTKKMNGVGEVFGQVIRKRKEILEERSRKWTSKWGPSATQKTIATLQSWKILVCDNSSIVSWIWL